MRHILHRYATPLMTGLFVVSLVSGALLFFHLAPRGVHGMHEWLSMVLILPFALHLWRNWRPMTGYFRHAPMAVALALSAAAAGAFLIPTGAERVGNPAVAVLDRVAHASAAQIAPALNTTPDAVTTALAGAGIAVSSVDQPLADAAAAAGKSTMDLAAALQAAGR